MMKLFTHIIMIFLIASVTLKAQDSTSASKANIKTVKHGKHFVDKDGDGYNDNAPDHDGDGIPNGLDPDYLKIKKRKNADLPFIDLDGDGINDNLQFGLQKRNGRHNRSFVNPLHGTMNGGEDAKGSGRQRGKGKKGNG